MSDFGPPLACSISAAIPATCAVDDCATEFIVLLVKLAAQKRTGFRTTGVEVRFPILSKTMGLPTPFDKRKGLANGGVILNAGVALTETSQTLVAVALLTLPTITVENL